MYKILQGLPELLCKLFLAAKPSSILIVQHYLLVMKKKPAVKHYILGNIHL